jgi:hypothetical protein
VFSAATGTEGPCLVLNLFVRAIARAIPVSSTSSDLISHYFIPLQFLSPLHPRFYQECRATEGCAQLTFSDGPAAVSYASRVFRVFRDLSDFRVLALRSLTLALDIFLPFTRSYHQYSRTRCSTSTYRRFQLISSLRIDLLRPRTSRRFLHTSHRSGDQSRDLRLLLLPVRPPEEFPDDRRWDM